MKYKIIPDDVVKNIIEFLDEIQFEAAAGNKQDDLHRINFINRMISELMDGIDGVDLPRESDEDTDIEDRSDIINNYRNKFGMEFPEDMTEEEWKKLIKQFDSFIEGWDKSYKKSQYEDVVRQDGLKKFLSELRIDHELTNEEKFELYYDEYSSLKKQKEGKTLNETLKKAGIKKPPSNNQTPKK